jgi:hypothetical protein
MFKLLLGCLTVTMEVLEAFGCSFYPSLILNLNLGMLLVVLAVALNI